jgi:carbon monoxide dehydrogenase subunit G
MELINEELILLPIQNVWDGLNDPEILKACIPGCEAITKVSETEYKIALMAAVGPVKVRFNGKLRLEDIRPPTSYAIVFEGTGGPAGFAKGGARVQLTPEEHATRLSYKVDAQIGGKIAQVGARLIDSVARQTAAEFFTRFNETVAPRASADGSAAATASPAVPELRPKRQRPRAGLWAAGLALAVLALGAYLLR